MQPTPLAPISNQTGPLSNYRVLECDLKVCIASIGVVDATKPFRSCSRTHYLESTVFVFRAVDLMVAMLFFAVDGEYLKKF